MFLEKGTYILKEFNRMLLFRIYIEICLKKFIYKEKILVPIVKEYYKYKSHCLDNLSNNFITVLYKNKRIIQLFLYNEVIKPLIPLFNKLQLFCY